MMKRINAFLATLLLMVLVAALIPVISAQFLDAPYASYQMQGSIGPLHGATIDHIEWRQIGGNTGTTRIIASDDLLTVVEFQGPTSSASPNVFQLTVFYENPALVGTLGAIGDLVTIVVVASDQDGGGSDGPTGIPEIDAGPDVTLFEGDFAN